MIFVQIASELLGRQIILYPVIPWPGNQDRVVILPSIPSNHSPYQLLLYEDHNFNTPHYQSLRPRTSQSFIETQESSQIPQEWPSMFSRLSAISDQSTTNTCFSFSLGQIQTCQNDGSVLVRLG